MFFELLLFHLSFVSFMYAILHFKEYKKSLSVLYIIVTTIFYSPVIYYSVLNGTAYRVFSDKDLKYFIILASVVFIQFSLLILFKNSYKLKPKKISLTSYNNPLLMVYILGIILVVFGYLILHFESLPLYQAVKYGLIIDRPDTVGYLPNYFTFSVISTLLLPGFYFFYINTINKNKFTKILILTILSLILVAGGNKGLIAYFFIFIWIYEFKLKINFKLIAMFISLFWIYLILKTGEILFSLETIEYSISSPIRRFFVSQGSGFLARISMMNEGFSFESVEAIKTYVYEAIYGVFGGSSPTYFLGDLVVKYGFFGGMIFHLLLLVVIFGFSRYIDTNYKNDLFIKWNFFIVLYLLGMAELSEVFLFRLLAVLVNILIVVILIKANNKKLAID